ncbi:hypothetical protein V6N13_124314 [Hibiscus sabdariffa]
MRVPEFNTDVDMANPQFKKGMIFVGKDILKEAVREYGIKNRVDLKFKRLDKKRMHVICKEGCPWYIWASRHDPKDKTNSTWQIKSYIGEHNCMIGLQNKNVTYKWLAKHYLEKYRIDSTYSIRHLKQDVMHDHVYKVSQSKCLRARNLALEMVVGSHKGQYSMIYDYLNELRITNPVVGVDANDNLYPIAYAVVEAENQSAWYWFLSLLATDLEIESNHNITFISDKQKGLMEALAEVFPSATHRTCVRHLYNNFKGKHLKDLLWKAARATYQKEFEDAMAELKAVSNDAFNWLNGNDPSQWSKSHFSSFCKSDMLLRNLSECFNKRPESFFDTCYRVTTQQQIYNRLITPMRGPNQWVHDTTCEPVIAPKLRRPPGRPKKKRVKEVDEPSKSTSIFTKRGATMYCSKCRKAGHNQRTCKGEFGGNIPVNTPRGTSNQRVGASVSEPSASLPKLPVRRPTTSSAQTNPLGLQSYPTQQPPSVMTPKNLLPGLSLDHDVLKCAGTPHPQIGIAMGSSISPMRVATLRNPPSILINREIKGNEN